MRLSSVVLSDCRVLVLDKGELILEMADWIDTCLVPQ